ncbi:hypothetical protein BDZ45DRAFT_672672, partial [Acephala macrosclerotiorum]
FALFHLILSYVCSSSAHSLIHTSSHFISNLTWPTDFKLSLLPTLHLVALLRSRLNSLSPNRSERHLRSTSSIVSTSTSATPRPSASITHRHDVATQLFRPHQASPPQSFQPSSPRSRPPRRCCRFHASR